MLAALGGKGGLPAVCSAVMYFDTVPVENSRQTMPGEDATGPWWKPEQG